MKRKEHAYKILKWKYLQKSECELLPQVLNHQATKFSKAKFVFMVFSFFLVFFFCFLGLHPWHMEVSRLGVESELELPDYATATASQDLSCVCDLHHNSQQSQIPYPLREVRYRTHILLGTSQICIRCTAKGTPKANYFDSSSITYGFPIRTSFNL